MCRELIRSLNELTIATQGIERVDPLRLEHFQHDCYTHNLLNRVVGLSRQWLFKTRKIFNTRTVLTLYVCGFTVLIDECMCIYIKTPSGLIFITDQLQFDIDINYPFGKEIINHEKHETI